MGGIFPVREWAIQVSGNSINSPGVGFPETGGGRLSAALHREYASPAAGHRDIYVLLPEHVGAKASVSGISDTSNCAEAGKIY
jgi:hypothetical protein